MVRVLHYGGHVCGLRLPSITPPTGSTLCQIIPRNHNWDGSRNYMLPSACAIHSKIYITSSEEDGTSSYAVPEVVGPKYSPRMRTARARVCVTLRQGQFGYSYVFSTHR
jgi:hypothetical protein